MSWDGTASPVRSAVGEAVEFFQYVVFNDPTWDYRTLEFDTAADAADNAAAGVLNVTDPNLKPFFDRGGKLLLYHGWNDQLVAPLNSVNYYTRVTSMLDPGKTASSIRLFMIARARSARIRRSRAIPAAAAQTRPQISCAVCRSARASARAMPARSRAG